MGITYHEEEGEEEDGVGEDHSRRPLGEGELLGLVGEAPVDVLPGSAKMLVNHFGWCCSNCEKESNEIQNERKIEINGR